MRLGKQISYLIIATFYLFSVLVSNDNVSYEWTWMIKKEFTQQERSTNAKKKAISLVKVDLPKFTQSIFSWNVARPKSGYFSFYAQARDAKTKKWYALHKMFDWGASIQKSYATIACQGTSYHHVRLELPLLSFADGIRIYVEPHQGAQLGDIHNLYISISRMDMFAAEQSTQFFKLPSVEIHGIPLLSQRLVDHPHKDRLCSPTSLAMLISYLTGEKIEPGLIAHSVHDRGLDAYGSWPFNTAHAFEQAHGAYFFYIRRLSSFAQVYELLKKNVPLVVSVRGLISGAPKEYPHGHLLVVRGWNQFLQKVLCHDPACIKNEDVAIEYSLKDFLRAWECSRRLAYIAEPASY